MANKFIPWIDEVEPGTTTQEQSVFADDSQRINGFVAGDPASAIRVNSALRQANVVVAALMQLADELVTLPDLDLNSTVTNITAALRASIITPLTTRLTNLENSFEEISGDAASLGQRITTLESEMDAVQSKNTEQDSSISAVDEKVDAHIERTDNPHSVTKAQVGLGNVDNVKQYSTSNPPPYPVRSVAGKTGAVTLTKSDVGLGNVDNTSDEDKPVSMATQTALNGKANTSGTYPNLTAGQATNATKLNNKSASEYALASDIPDVSNFAEKTGTYPNMNVGNATKATTIGKYQHNIKFGVRYRAGAIGTVTVQFAVSFIDTVLTPYTRTTLKNCALLNSSGVNPASIPTTAVGLFPYRGSTTEPIEYTLATGLSYNNGTFETHSDITFQEDDILSTDFYDTVISL